MQVKLYIGVIEKERIRLLNTMKIQLTRLIREIDHSSAPGSRNCAAWQRALQIILDLADKSSKRNII